MSQTFLDFLSKCLVKDYNLRWDTDELLKHPFLSSAKRSDLKVLLEKTLKRREVNKRTQVPLIDHTSLQIPVESPRPPPATTDHAEPSFVPLENSGVAADSMVLHSSTPTLPVPEQHERISVIELPTQEKKSNNLAWQQPGYSSQDSDMGYVESPRVELDKSPRSNEVSPLIKSNPKAKEDESCCSSCTIL